MKKFLSIILAILMIVTTVPVAFAVTDFEQQPTVQNGFTAKLSEPEADYQWYEALYTLTDANVESSSTADYNSDYGYWDIAQGMATRVYIYVRLNAGDVIVFTDIEGRTEEYYITEGEETYTVVNSLAKTSTYTVKNDGVCKIGFFLYRGMFGASPTIIEIAKSVEGASTNTLTNYECGKEYYCIATYDDVLYRFDAVTGIHVFEDGICTGCGYECSHETYTNEVCDICGWICDHLSVNVSEKNCDYCGRDIGSAEITVGETVSVNDITVYEFTPEYSGTYIVSSATATSDEYIDPSVELYKGDVYIDKYDDCYDENGEIIDYDFNFTYNYEAGQNYYLVVYGLSAIYGFTVDVECETHNWSEGKCLACGYVCDHSEQTGSACEICGATLHTCDFTGEWKYDSEKHWKECSCGAKEQIASHEDTLVQVDAKAPTCSAAGYEAYEHCTACDYTTYVEIPAITHTDANCDYKCDYNCGYEYETLDFSDAKVLTTVDGVLYIDGVEAETNSSKSQSRIYEGKYILEGDIETSRYIWIFGDTTLDLNGYTWNLTDKYIIVNAPLSIYDTSEAETGKITSGSSSLTISINDVAAGFNLYGGTIENTSSSGRCALDVSSADVNLYAGKIKSNSQAIRFVLGDEITLNIDGTVLESGDDYADVLVALGINAIAKGDIDVTDYKGDSLTAKVNVISTLGKITVFKGIKNTQEAEKYQIIDVVCSESFDLFWEKTEYDENTGEKSIYTANNAFTQQPSADNNLTVDFNNPAATFQWYEVEEKNLGTYIAEEARPLFSYDFKAGDVLKTSTDSELEFVVIEAGNEYIELMENEKTAITTFDADTTVDFFTGILEADNPVEINFTLINETKLDGETEKTLQNPECGKTYVCKTSVGENVYLSDVVTVGHNIVSVDAKAPTCTEIGWDAYEYCTACDYTTYEELPVDPDAHDWSNKDGVCAYGCGTVCDHAGQTGSACEICGATLHTCDFSGEWKYDSENHWKECECGLTDEEAEHSYIDGVCDECGYECSHKWGEGAFTRPTRTEEGCYTYTCSICKDTKIELVERASNYAEFKELLENVKGYLDENLTDSMMQEVNNVINFFELDENHCFIKGEENTVSQMIRQISGFIEVVEEGIADGTALKADYTYIDEVIKEIEEKFADEYLTDERKAKLEQIKSDIEKLKADPDTSVADLEGLERSVYNIFTAAESCFNGYHDGPRYELTEEAKCGKNAVESATCSFCGKVLTREVENSALTHSFTKYEVTEEAKCGVEGKKVAACDHGCGETDEKAIEALRHSFTKYEVTEEAKCGVAGKEVAACDNGCGETDEKAIEALRHSFTKYEVTEEAKCGVEGKEAAYCDNGCGETDEKAIAALTHKDADGDYKCDHGCGHEFEKPAPEEPTPDTPDEPTDEVCDHLCHKGGFMGFIWKIVKFFSKLFKLNPVCECGAAHY